jgi:hypothetical protein
MSKASRGLASAIIAWAGLGSGSVAQAKSQFPQAIQDDLVPRLVYQVPCSVCHIKDTIDSSTAITPFARSLEARGLSGQAASLKTALTQLETDGVDSDGDGTPDIAELQAETDPNSSANGPLVGEPEPAYGCGGTPPRGRGGGLPVGAGVVAIAWLLLRRRRGCS